MKLIFLFLSFSIFIQGCGRTKFDAIPSASSVSSEVSELGQTEQKSCRYDGQTIKHNETIETFRASSVPYNQSCIKDIHTCLDGEFSGVLGFKECAQGVPRDCKIGVDTIKHGASATRFQAATVAYDQNCQVETRSCLNGVLSGSFTAPSCDRQSPPAPTGKLICVRRLLGPDEGYASANYYRQDLYEEWSDGTKRLKELCNDWQALKENPALNCGAQISGTSGLDHGYVNGPNFCCPVGRVSINGTCQTENGISEYCFADSQCRAGLKCVGPSNFATCQPK